MSDIKETSGQPDHAAGGDGQETGAQQNSNDFVKRDSFLKALAEKKSAQAKANELAAKLKEFEEKELATSNQFQELAAKRSKEAEELKQKLDKQNKVFAYKVFEKEAKTKALEMGANPKALDALIKSGDFSEVEIDYENFEVNQEQLANAIARMQKENEFFFTKTAKTPKDVQLSNSLPTSKPLSEMSSSEIEKLLKSGAFT